MRPIIQKSYAANKAVVFNGDGYSDEWHAEAERRGLLNLRSTPDALPFLIRDDTITAFSNYGVLSERELHARYEVFLEQYVTKLNIESETAASIARTLLLPAAVRYKAGSTAEEPEMASELGELIASFVDELKALEAANLKENHQEDYGILTHARYMHDTVFPAMGAVREVADRLEKVVADYLGRCRSTRKSSRSSSDSALRYWRSCKLRAPARRP